MCVCVDKNTGLHGRINVRSNALVSTVSTGLLQLLTCFTLGGQNTCSVW